MVRLWCRVYAAEIDVALDQQRWVVADFAGSGVPDASLVKPADVETARTLLLRWLRAGKLADGQ